MSKELTHFDKLIIDTVNALTSAGGVYAVFPETLQANIAMKCSIRSYRRYLARLADCGHIARLGSRRGYCSHFRYGLIGRSGSNNGVKSEKGIGTGVPMPVAIMTGV